MEDKTVLWSRKSVRCIPLMTSNMLAGPSENKEKTGRSPPGVAQDGFRSGLRNIAPLGLLQDDSVPVHIFVGAAASVPVGIE
jgi:hypothetical protein